MNVLPPGAVTEFILRRSRVLKAAETYIRLIETKVRKKSRLGPLSRKILDARQELSEAVWAWKENK